MTYIEELVTDIKLLHIYVIFGIRSMSNGSNRDGCRGLPVFTVVEVAVTLVKI
jgi:hypothetical protein